MRPAALALVLFSTCAMTLAQAPNPASQMPDRFVIGRETYIDIGPPFNFIELLLANPSDYGTLIERVILTPGYRCALPPKVEVAKATMKTSVAQVLGKTNPCAIPEKDLNRELDRKKQHLIFSGANVSMQVECGGQTRIIRSDILGEDMFVPTGDTPKNTSWMMRVLAGLDNALGPGVLDKPMVTLPEDSGGSAPLPDSPTFQEIAAGKYDQLFPETNEKPSQIYLSTKGPNPTPEVILGVSTPFDPITAPLPQYPESALAAKLQGDFVFSVDVQKDGRTTNFTVRNGAPDFRAAVEDASRGWVFPSRAARKRIIVTIEFAINCYGGP